MPTTDVRPVTPEFFKTMGIPHLAGRDFAESDTADAPLVAIVSEGLVRRYLPGEDPLGKRLQVSIGIAGRHERRRSSAWSATSSSLRSMPTRALAIYIPLPQLSIGLMTFVVRTDLDPMSLAQQRQPA